MSSSELTPTNTTAKAWADEARLPGESDEKAMRRRITMHEFLMTGGVQTGLDKAGHMTYSTQITLDDLAKDAFEDCPWHGADCAAWNLIVSGNGHWTKLERELQDLLRVVDDGELTVAEFEVAQEEILQMEQALEFRPRSIPFDHQRPKVQPKPVRDHDADRKVFAQAGQKKGPFPWSQAGDQPQTHYKPKPAVARDARNAAEDAFGGLTSDVPDTIIIEGDEDDE